VRRSNSFERQSTRDLGPKRRRMSSNRACTRHELKMILGDAKTVKRPPELRPDSYLVIWTKPEHIPV